MNDIDFNTYKDEIFNDLIYKLQEAKTRYVINYGGAGSGKSFTQTQHEILNCLENKERLLVIRKVGNTLKDSVIQLFRDVLKSWELPIDLKENKTDQFLEFYNGSKIIFKGMDDPEKIKSIAGITRIWIEEASELEEPDFDQLNLRLRGKENLQITLTFNPIDESHWIKKRFFDYHDAQTTIIKTTYLDNKFIDEGYKNTLENYKITDYNYYRVYALGEWGKLDSGAEFYKKFNPAINVKAIEYDHEAPLHCSFDENVNPYITCIISQCQGKKINFIDEICFEPPQNNIQYVTTEIEKRYKNHLSGIFIYGDATSRKKDAKLEIGHNFFTLIQKYLSVNFKTCLRVPISNPSVMMRGLFANEIFAGEIPEIEININVTCKKLIEDLKYVKQDADGTKLKEKAKNPKTLVTYEKYGHCSDAFDYLICEYLKNDYIIWQNRTKILKPGGVSIINRTKKITI